MISWSRNVCPIVKLKGLLVNNQSVFSMFKFDLSLTNLVQHKIDTKDEKPVKIPPAKAVLEASLRPMPT
jgi:hypothetical protein